MQPQYPEGTPEYAAYAAELREELRKWADGEDPYSYAQPEEGHAYRGDGIHGCDAMLAGKIRCGAGVDQHPRRERTT